MADHTPAYHDRELGLREAERINRLLGLRLKYIIGIPVGLVAGYLAGLAGADQMLTVVAFIIAQVAYGYGLARFEVRRARRLAQRRPA